MKKMSTAKLLHYSSSLLCGTLVLVVDPIKTGYTSYVLVVCLVYRLCLTSQFALEALREAAVRASGRTEFCSWITEGKMELRCIFVLEYGTFSFSCWPLVVLLLG